MVQTSVVILSGHSLFAEGVASRLRQHLQRVELKVVDPRQTDAMAQIVAARPSTVILDVFDPEATQIFSLSKLLLLFPALKVIRLDSQQQKIQVVTSEQRWVDEIGELIDMIEQSAFEPAFEPVTLIELLRRRALGQPDELAYTFLVDGETKEVHLTYEEVDRQARAIGALLQSLVKTGERALLLYPSGLEYVAAFLGCLYAGVVAVPVYPPDPVRLERTLPRFRAIANDARPSVALTTSPILSMVESLFTMEPDFQAMHWLATDNLDDDLAAEWRDPEVNSDSLAFLQYTSGSTAAPKGVMVSHGNILHNERTIQQAFGHTEKSTVFGWLPLYHDMGLIGNVLQPLYIGARCILMSPLDFLQRPFRWLQAISRYQARTSGGPNFAYDLCVRKITPEQRATLDLSSWEVAYNGAEPIRRETLERFAATFEPCGFHREALYPCYGLAEATLFVSGGLKSAPPIFHTVQGAALERNRVVAVSPEDEEAQTLVGSGRTWTDQKIVIVDPESLTRLPPDRVGEVWVSGANVARGYWNLTRETERTFRAYLADTGEGPFLRTGDLGFLKDGELFITGRLKDLIIIDGRNHYPQDIELTVEKSHPALRPGCCAAFSVDVGGKERLVVVTEVDRRYKPERRPGQVEPGSDSAPGLSSGAEEIIKTIRQAVAEYHDVRAYDVLLLKAGSMPKTSSGKIQRHACRADFLAGVLDVWEG
jgi:acyl-CoA synthetase (AMP-forming)/AMP-acid ligase II